MINFEETRKKMNEKKEDACRASIDHIILSFFYLFIRLF